MDTTADGYLHAGVRMMGGGMDQTTLLYALSTLAQASAALVAFVGAVGLYRLQGLKDYRRKCFNEMEREVANTNLPSYKVLELAKKRADEPKMKEFIDRLKPADAAVTHFRRHFWAAESITMLGVLLPLIAFVYVEHLKAWCGTALAFGALSLVAVAGTTWMLVNLAHEERTQAK